MWFSPCDSFGQHPFDTSENCFHHLIMLVVISLTFQNTEFWFICLWSLLIASLKLYFFGILLSDYFGHHIPDAWEIVFLPLRIELLRWTCGWQWNDEDLFPNRLSVAIHAQTFQRSQRCVLSFHIANTNDLVDATLDAHAHHFFSSPWQNVLLGIMGQWSLLVRRPAHDFLVSILCYLAPSTTCKSSRCPHLCSSSPSKQLWWSLPQ